MVVPDGLDEQRHVGLDGRGAHPFVRRGALLLLAVLVVAALVDLFGQHPTTSRASAPFATLAVQSPHALRGGLIFQARLTVHARTTIRHPTLVLEHGWFESMSVNSILPDPGPHRCIEKIHSRGSRRYQLARVRLLARDDVARE